MDSKQIEEIAKLQNFFKADNGMEVLELLSQITGYFDSPMGSNEADTYRLIGRREVMIELLQALNINTSELLVMLKDSEEAERFNGELF